MRTTALFPWFGSSRMIAERIGELVGKCGLCCVPFSGGLCDLVHLQARTLIINDLHHLAINVVKVLADDQLGPKLIRRLRRLPFSTELLSEKQFLLDIFKKPLGSDRLNDKGKLDLAEAYFYSAWVSRNGLAGTTNELTAGPAIRWEAGGGDSAVRLNSAVAGLREWRKIIHGSTITCMDGLIVIQKVKDQADNAIFADPPFLGPGEGYKHNVGTGDTAELWHRNLRDELLKKKLCRIVCRFYDHPVIQKLYPESDWTWHRIDGRKQTNDSAPEVLLVRRR